MSKVSAIVSMRNRDPRECVSFMRRKKMAAKKKAKKTAKKPAKKAAKKKKK